MKGQIDNLVVDDLIRQTQKGNIGSFRELVNVSKQYVFVVAFKILSNDEQAREVTHECFIKVWKNIAQFNFQNKFTTWIYKIAVNICYDKLREQKNRNKFFVNYDDAEPEMNFNKASDTYHQLDNKELAEHIEFISRQLPAKQRIVFSLRDLQGFNIEEVVEITGMSSSSVKTNLVYARKAVKQKLIKRM